MKKEKEHLYELIIGQLLFDEYINIADQLYWAVECTKNILPDCELTQIYDKQTANQAQETEDVKVSCICGHPGSSCRPVRPAQLESGRPESNRRNKQRTNPDMTESKVKKKRGRPRKKVTDLHHTAEKERNEMRNADQVKYEVTEDTSDYLSELDSVLQSSGGDNECSGEFDQGHQSDTFADKLNNDEDVQVPKRLKKRGRSRNKHSADKVSIVSKRKGIAGKLIKKAMREARKEPKAERRKRTVFMCNYCLSKFTLFGLKEHLKSHCTVSGEELKCNLCFKVLMCGNRILNFNSHLRLHGNMQHFLCSICGTGFKSEGAYKYHKEMHKDKRHTCEICKKTFKARGLLRSHMMTHSSVKSHICEYCAKGFRTATLLAKHVMIHTGEKPYRCEECGAEFRMSSHLRRHKDVHAGRKMYVCSVCNHAVYQRTNMRVHMKVHTGVRYSPIYVCNKCKMAFPAEENLNEHATGCRLTESAYEQQQRLGLQQKPAPLRVKRSRQSKDNVPNNQWSVECSQSASSSMVPDPSNNLGATAHFHQPLSEAPTSHPQVQLSAGAGSVTSQQHLVQNIDNSKPNVSAGRLVPQQLASGVQDLQHRHRQPHQQDIIQQQSQFLQQLHAHQLYPQFYMQ